MGIPSSALVTKLTHMQPPLRNYQYLRPVADIGLQMGGKYVAGSALQSLARDLRPGVTADIAARAGQQLIRSAHSQFPALEKRLMLAVANRP